MLPLLRLNHRSSCCLPIPTQDPPSLDTAIQHTLAGLYPPFEATAPTVLAQVFRLLDSDFRGDGLSFLLDFLVPAKRLCEQVREAACVSRGTGPGDKLFSQKAMELERTRGWVVGVAWEELGLGIVFLGSIACPQGGVCSSYRPS